MNNYQIFQLGFSDLESVQAIEDQVYSHPWTRGNFVDSLQNAHIACGLRDNAGQLMGYYFLMPVIDELHLLTFAIAKKFQQQGYAPILLEKMLSYARERQYKTIMLEVRVSNVRAISVYTRFGFVEIGRRKAYYQITTDQREDAIVMRIDC